MGVLFGTDGIRGIANEELTPEMAYRIGQAGAYVLTQHKREGRPVIYIGRDTRISGNMLECALAAGICSVGGDVHLLGVVPTPAVAYLTREQDADAGVVISASHNPFQYNGIKFFNNEGYKLNDDIEAEIEGHILDNNKDIPLSTGGDLGRVTTDTDKVQDYLNYIKNSADADLSGYKIVMDCANGATSALAGKLFSDAGAEVIVMHAEPNGININKDCGSTHMEGLMKKVVEEKADIGFAFDGDADRFLAVDDTGALVDGDVLMMICSKYLKDTGKLANNTLVATVMSNLGLFIAAKENGIDVLQTKVGDRYVLEEMLKGGHCIGGEQSGHIIFLQHNTTGDGMLTAMQLMNVLVHKKQKLSEMKDIVTILPQVIKNAKVKNENKAIFMEDEQVKSRIDELNQKFDGNGRVLIRASGTEPLVRVMLEGTDLDEIERDAAELAEMIQTKFY